jgi:two-component system response regulator BaeR
MSDVILIVEDEERLADIQHKYLQQAGYESHVLSEGNNVVSWVKNNKPSLILLDLMLPGKDGLDICKEIRKFSTVPIIMVTARVEEIDRLLGLELGADDYVCKPYSPREVVARVKAVLRRTSGKHEPVGLLSLDKERYAALLNGNELDLTALEFRLLEMLTSRPGVIFSRDQLMENIYEDQRIVYDRTIDSHIRNLRKKISMIEPDLDIIRSVYGVGYKYEEG